MADKQFLTHVDLTQNELRNAILQVLGSAPASPLEGQIYYDSGLARAQIYNGSSFKDLGIVQSVGNGLNLDSAGNLTIPSNAIQRNELDESISPVWTGTHDFTSGGILLPSGAVDAIGEIDSSLRSGADSTLLTGTAGSAGNVAEFNSDGDIVDSAVPSGNIIQSDGSVPFAADQSMGGNLITNHGTPSADADVATKGYVDSVASGLTVREAVRVATAGNNIDLTGGGFGGSIDGVSLNDQDRALIKDQSTASENGIYVYDPGSNTFSRASDFDEDSEVTAGSFTFVEEGTSNADTGWVVSSDDPISVGTDPINWTQFSGAGQVDAGAGLGKSGSTIFVKDGAGLQIISDQVTLDWTSLTSLGTSPASADLLAIYDDSAGNHKEISISELEGGLSLSNLSGTLSVSKGGTGAGSASGARSNLSVPGQFSTTIGDGASTSITVNHGLGTRFVHVTIFRNSSPYDEVEADVEHTDSSSVTINFNDAPSTDEFAVFITGLQ